MSGPVSNPYLRAVPELPKFMLGTHLTPYAPKLGTDSYTAVSQALFDPASPWRLSYPALRAFIAIRSFASDRRTINTAQSQIAKVCGISREQLSRSKVIQELEEKKILTVKRQHLKPDQYRLTDEFLDASAFDGSEERETQWLFGMLPNRVARGRLSQVWPSDIPVWVAMNIMALRSDADPGEAVSAYPAVNGVEWGRYTGIESDHVGILWPKHNSLADVAMRPAKKIGEAIKRLSMAELVAPCAAEECRRVTRGTANHWHLPTVNREIPMCRDCGNQIHLCAGLGIRYTSCGGYHDVTPKGVPMPPRHHIHWPEGALYTSHQSPRRHHTSEDQSQITEVGRPGDNRVPTRNTEEITTTSVSTDIHDAPAQAASEAAATRHQAERAIDPKGIADLYSDWMLKVFPKEYVSLRDRTAINRWAKDRLRSEWTIEEIRRAVTLYFKRQANNPTLTQGTHTAKFMAWVKANATEITTPRLSLKEQAEIANARSGRPSTARRTTDENAL